QLPRGRGFPPAAPNFVRIPLLTTVHTHQLRGPATTAAGACAKGCTHETTLSAVRVRFGGASSGLRPRFETASRPLRLRFGAASGALRVRFGAVRHATHCVPNTGEHPPNLGQRRLESMS